VQFHIPGPAGNLEAVLTEAANPDDGHYAVLCHPHPRFGGSMFDAVLDVAQRALIKNGVSCVRFNFRGVGASDGVHDGEAEADDVAAVVSWVRAAKSPTSVVLAGYSFGAVMAWTALDRIDTPDRVLLIAPPVGYMDLPSRSPGCPVDAVAGDADEFVDINALTAWEGVQAHLLSGCSHFFTGQYQELEQRLTSTLDG